MPCNYLKKLCKSGCDNYNCRAFFPERQPMVEKNTLPLCMSEDYQECPQWEAGTEWREKRRLDKISLHCPFTSNNICNHPEIWTCKGSYTPFRLYPAIIKETFWKRTWRIIKTYLHLMEPLEYYEGEPVEFSKKLLEETCWSGDKEIYQECPFFKDGLEQYNKTPDDVFKSNKNR